MAEQKLPLLAPEQSGTYQYLYFSSRSLKPGDDERPVQRAKAPFDSSFLHDIDFGKIREYDYGPKASRGTVDIEWDGIVSDKGCPERFGTLFYSLRDYRTGTLRALVWKTGLFCTFYDEEDGLSALGPMMYGRTLIHRVDVDPDPDSPLNSRTGVSMTLYEGAYDRILANAPHTNEDAPFGAIAWGMPMDRSAWRHDVRCASYHGEFAASGQPHGFGTQFFVHNLGQDLVNFSMVTAFQMPFLSVKVNVLFEKYSLEPAGTYVPGSGAINPEVARFACSFDQAEWNDSASKTQRLGTVVKVSKRVDGNTDMFLPTGVLRFVRACSLDLQRSLSLDGAHQFMFGNGRSVSSMDDVQRVCYTHGAFEHGCATQAVRSFRSLDLHNFLHRQKALTTENPLFCNKCKGNLAILTCENNEPSRDPLREQGSYEQQLIEAIFGTKELCTLARERLDRTSTLKIEDLVYTYEHALVWGGGQSWTMVEREDAVFVLKDEGSHTLSEMATLTKDMNHFRTDRDIKFKIDRQSGINASTVRILLEFLYSQYDDDDVVSSTLQHMANIVVFVEGCCGGKQILYEESFQDSLTSTIASLICPRDAVFIKTVLHAIQGLPLLEPPGPDRSKTLTTFEVYFDFHAGCTQESMKSLLSFDELFCNPISSGTGAAHTLFLHFMNTFSQEFDDDKPISHAGCMMDILRNAHPRDFLRRGDFFKETFPFFPKFDSSRLAHDFALLSISTHREELLKIISRGSCAQSTKDSLHSPPEPKESQPDKPLDEDLDFVLESLQIQEDEDARKIKKTEKNRKKKQREKARRNRRKQKLMEELLEEENRDTSTDRVHKTAAKHVYKDPRRRQARLKAGLSSGKQSKLSPSVSEPASPKISWVVYRKAWSLPDAPMDTWTTQDLSEWTHYRKIGEHFEYLNLQKFFKETQMDGREFCSLQIGTLRLALSTHVDDPGRLAEALIAQREYDYVPDENKAAPQECPLCMEEYEDVLKTPRLLACGHTAW